MAAGAGPYSQPMLIDRLEWLGHSGFRLSTGRSVVYIDPYRVPAGPKADLILITHGHYDHFSPQDQGRTRGGHNCAPRERLRPTQI